MWFKSILLVSVAPIVLSLKSSAPSNDLRLNSKHQGAFFFDIGMQVMTFYGYEDKLISLKEEIF